MNVNWRNVAIAVGVLILAVFAFLAGNGNIDLSSDEAPAEAAEVVVLSSGRVYLDAEVVAINSTNVFVVKVSDGDNDELAGRTIVVFSTSGEQVADLEVGDEVSLSGYFSGTGNVAELSGDSSWSGRF